MTAAPTGYWIRSEALEPPAVSVHVDDWTFTVTLHDEECMVIAIDGDREIIGGSIQEVIFGVLDEYHVPLPAGVRFLRHELYHVLEDVRTVLWSLAEIGEDSPHYHNPSYHPHTQESC